MPQLVPFYFVNEITFTLFLLGALIYFMAKYLLPSHLKLLVSRLFIS